MTVRFATLTLCLLAALPVHAERADRDKPMLLEASRVSIDDAKKIQILEGDVVITKGTMILKADRVVIPEGHRIQRQGRPGPLPPEARRQG